MSRRRVASLFAIVSALTHGLTFGTVLAPGMHLGDSIAGRLLYGLIGALYGGFLPTLGFCVVLLLLPRISRTTARAYLRTTALVAMLAVCPAVYLVWGPPAQPNVVAFIYVFNPALVFCGAVILLLAAGVLERAPVRDDRGEPRS